MVEQGSGGDGSAGLGDEAGRMQVVSGACAWAAAIIDGTDGGADLVLGDSENGVDEGVDVRPVARAEGLGAEPVGDRAGGELGGPALEGAELEAFACVACQLGLDADDGDLGPLMLDGRGDAGEQAAARNRNEHEVHIGYVFENLETAGALAGDDGVIVVGRDHLVAVLRGELLSTELTLGAGRADVDNFGAESPSGRTLDLGRVRRHDDDGRNPEGAGDVGNSLGVVAA